MAIEKIMPYAGLEGDQECVINKIAYKFKNGKCYFHPVFENQNEIKN